MTERRKTCLQCGEKIEQTEGRRERKFCKGTDCAQKYWLKTHPKEKRFKRIPVNQKLVQLPADYVNWKSVGILKLDGTIEELKDISQLPESFRGIIPAVEATGMKAEYDLNKSIIPIPDNKEVPDNSKNEERIKQLEKEINNPPAKFTSLIAKQAYFFDRRKELAKLKSA